MNLCKVRAASNCIRAVHREKLEKSLNEIQTERKRKKNLSCSLLRKKVHKYNIRLAKTAHKIKRKKIRNYILNKENGYVELKMFAMY